MLKKQPLPQFSRIDFYRLHEDELMSAFAKVFMDHVERFPDTSLTDQQLAILTWSKASFDVPNGGFVQFYYNNRGINGIKELAVLLDTLDLRNASTVLLESIDVYLIHCDQFDVSNPWDNLFGKVNAFDKLDRSFCKISPRCTRAIETWIRSHIVELASSETGGVIDSKYTGTIEIRYPNGEVKEYLEVKKGKPHGAFREYFEDGSFRNGTFYKSGKISGDFWPDGKVKRKESKKGPLQIIEWYYPNGSICKRYVSNKDGYVVEPIQLFHENGQLAEEVTKDKGKRLGPWLKFFDDGTPELQAEYTADGQLLVHNAWDNDRKQIVTNGTGTFRDPRRIDWEYDIFLEGLSTTVSELKNGVPNGKVCYYTGELLTHVSQYLNGKREGDTTHYWDNGRVRSITKYVDGAEKKTKNFPKFDNPKPAVVLTVTANEKYYKAWEHNRVDEYPQVLNIKEVQSQLLIPQFLLDVHQRNLEGKILSDYEDCHSFKDGIYYFLTVNESGEVTTAKATGSSIYSGGMWKNYLPFLLKLRFTPGQIRGRAIQCRALAVVDHTFIEGGSASTVNSQIDTAQI